jgi:hypothetical protein
MATLSMLSNSAGLKRCLLAARYYAAAGLLMLALPARAESLQCPPSIAETPAVALMDSHWTVVAPAGQRPLEHAGIYLRVGSDYSAQVPDSTRRKKRDESVRWQLPAPGRESYWLGCSYHGTTARLFVQVKPEARSCTVTYSLLPTGKRQRVKGIECG